MGRNPERGLNQLKNKTMFHTHFILMNGSEPFAVVERLNAPYANFISETAVKQAIREEFGDTLISVSIHLETDTDFIIEAEFDGYKVIINALPTWLYSINENYTETLENAITNSDMVAVTCGDCGISHVQPIAKENTEYKCPECGYQSEPCDFPDITKNIA